MGKPVLTGGQTRTGFDKLGPMTWPWRFFASFRGPHGHGRAAALGRGVAAYFTQFAPHFWVALAPALILAAVVYSRSPASNFIFDEQEALLANPYINGDSFGYLDAFRRDFWGLPPTRTIGSYRPLPNLIWWPLWRISELPWLHHWINIVVHAVNAALVAALALRLTAERTLSWLAGAAFLLAAVITEAVSGVVGLADVLGGLFILLALHALRLPMLAMVPAVFFAIVLGLLSKESVLVAVPLIGWAALVTAPVLHPKRPLRLLRAGLAWCFTGLALVGYTYFRRHFFPVALPAELTEPLPASAPFYEQAMHEFMRWFQQPRLPRDPINNPLVEAGAKERVAGALRVYVHGLAQVIFPYTLSGDYSYAAEPVPTRLVSVQTVLGGLFLTLPPLAALGCWVLAWRRERQTQEAGKASGLVVAAIALMWIPVAYFPHSNIPTLLPTVRAERFWYLPVIGSSLLIAWVFARTLGRWRVGATLGCVMFFGFQALQARTHALHYSDDLAFWRAARNAVPESAKAHLNYAVMVGARGRLDDRLAAGEKAMQIAPEWAMAHVYQGDTLCRMKRERGWDGKTMAKHAFPHYKRGFELNPNDVNLVALALQCLYDQKGLPHVEDELMALADEHPGSWVSYLVRDIIDNGDKYRGVNPKYRPRGYNEGPKQSQAVASETSDQSD